MAYPHAEVGPFRAQPPEGLLVRFWMLVSRISSDRVPAEVSHASPEQEEREAVHALLALLEEWDGPLASDLLLAMLAAADRLRAQGADGLGLLFTVGEEVGSEGARAAKALDPGSRFVVVGEPTQGRMASGHNGVFRFTLRAEGRAAHSAYPELGVSAIEHLLDALDAIRRAPWGKSARLGPATVNVGMLQGGLAANVIAPAAEAQVLVRVVGRAEDARAVLEGLLAGRPGLSYETTAWADAVHCQTRPGWEAEPVRFGTDIPYLGEGFGAPLLIGPGSIHDAHTAGEKILKRELVEAVEFYERLVGDLLQEAV